MKIAALILSHKNPKQINMLLDRLNCKDIDCYLHIDKSADFAGEIIKRDNVFVLPDSKRVKCEWAQISLVDATLNMLDYAKSNGGYDYYWLMSGQDWPIKSTEQIVEFLSNSENKNYIYYLTSKNHGNDGPNNLDKRNHIFYPLWIIGRKPWQRVMKRAWVEISGGYNRTWALFRRKENYEFYFGSQWWCLNRKTIEWMMKYLSNHPEYHKFYKNCSTPDESFFHTLVMMSPYAAEGTDVLTYLHYHNGPANSPDVITKDVLDEAKASKYLLMRKVDMDVDDSFVSYKF